MSTLREMAEAVSKSLDEEVEFFLVVRQRKPEAKTGHKPAIVVANVGQEDVLNMAALGTTRLALKRLMDERRKGGHG